MYDAVVVGGGIVGASTAYHLARSGTRTLLLDRRDEGRATDAGAGIVSPATSSRTDDVDWFQFAVDGFEYYRPLVDRLETESDESTGVARTGLLAVALGEADVERFEHRLAAIERRSSEIGYPEPGTVEEIDPGLAGELFPPLSDAHRVFKYENGMRIDGTKLTTALQRAGESHGLAITHEDVTGIETENGQVTGVVGRHDRYEADAVVVAGGAWSGKFGDQLGVAVPVEPQRGQLVHLDLPETDPVDWPIVTGFRDHYLVPWPDGRIVAGATREADAGFDPRPTPGGVRTVLDGALRLAPGLEAATFRDVDVGLRPASPDGRPILGPVPDVDGAFLATGHGPTGLQIGPYSGRIVAQLVRDETPEADVSAFRPDRFSRE
ncbi:MAG TPA: FAD-dependent oxidoreductase [Natrialbaceae archaeon]|nr:FAD-dependent oxidoreductase [Natrialbaceae archaeon]